MTIPVFKVALSGKRIDSTDPKDFALHSSYSSIKIYKKGSGSQTVGASTNVDVSITHNLGFHPICKLYVELTPGSGRWYAKPFNYISTENTYINGNLDKTYANTSIMNFNIINNTASSKTINYYYSILGHQAK